MPWRHRIENFRASVKRADAGRPTHFVSGKGEEIATQFLHIERQMSRALRRIDQRERAHVCALCAQSSATGLIVPSEFETCVKAKSFTSGVSNDGS